MGNVGVVERALEFRMDLIANRILTTARINLLKNDSVVSGSLFDSGKVESPDSLTRVISFDASQARWVEFGTQPHPIGEKGIAAIAAWGQRKFGMSEKAARSMAYGYAQNVALEGMTAKPFLRPAVDEELINLG